MSVGNLLLRPDRCDSAASDISSAPESHGVAMMTSDAVATAPVTRLACRPRRLVPARAEAGMRLIEDVCLPNGATLLSAGTVLETDSLQRLVQRQVDIIVVAVPDDRTPEQVAADLEAITTRLGHIFRGPNSPARQLLKESVVAYRLASALPCPHEL